MRLKSTRFSAFFFKNTYNGCFLHRTSKSDILIYESKLRCRSLVWHKNPSVLCVFGLPFTDNRLRARGAQEEKQGKQGLPLLLSLSVSLVPPVPPAIPFVHGYLF